MSHERWKAGRLRRGWTQQEAAARLGVSQAYLSMLEEGRRSPSPDLACRLMKAYRLSPTVLSLSDVAREATAESFARDLGALGYPGFAHLRRGTKKVNPAVFLLSALAQNNLEARVVEALPWLVFRYSDMDFDWLIPHARIKNLQNRLGFSVTLARLAGKNEALRAPEKELADSKLEKQDTFCKELSEPERRWLRKHRSQQAAQWNLLTDLRPETLRYVA